MQRIIYIIIFAIVVLIFKAFFLDDYLKSRESETNETTSVEEVKTDEASKVEPSVSKSIPEKKVHSSEKNEGMPIDQLGDSIAEKLDDKL